MRARPLADPGAAAIRGIVFDMDGTLAVGSPSGGGFTLLPGALDLIAHLRAIKLPFVVFTNGTAKPPERYAESLAEAGLVLDPGQMMTPSSVAADRFVALGLRHVLVLGVDGVAKPLRDAGLRTSHPGEAAAGAIDAVYVGWHPDFGMPDIVAAVEAVEAGATLYVSSDVSFFFTNKGRTIGASGVIAAAVTSVTGQPAVLVGKPSGLAAAHAAQRLGCAVEALAIIGDDPRLEAAMARGCGATGIGVTTGLACRAEWDAQPEDRRAHHLVDRLDAILGLLPPA
jgi:NagD protein